MEFIIAKNDQCTIEEVKAKFRENIGVIESFCQKYVENYEDYEDIEDSETDINNIDEVIDLFSEMLFDSTTDIGTKIDNWDIGYFWCAIGGDYLFDEFVYDCLNKNFETENFKIQCIRGGIDED